MSPFVFQKSYIIFYHSVLDFYGGWFNYEKEFEDAIESGKITNVHTVYFEELKKVSSVLFTCITQFHSVIKY